MRSALAIGLSVALVFQIVPMGTVGTGSIALPASPIPSASMAAMNFTESSTGLNAATWEIGPTELEFFDWNGDGHLDIMSIGDHGSPNINAQEHGLMVYKGDGAGSWNLEMNGDWGYGGLGVGDVNNDGIPDIVVGMHHAYVTDQSKCGSDIQNVCLGPNLDNWSKGLGSVGETWGMFDSDFGDFDNDGWLDVGQDSFGCCNGVQMYRNNHDGSWTNTGIRRGGNANNGFLFADINADGNLDAIATNEIGAVWFGDGKGKWTATQSGLPPTGGTLGFRGPSVGDVNNDGFLDYSFIARIGSNYQVQLFLWDDAGGTWKDDSSAIKPHLNSSGYQKTQIGDVDLDGNLDVLVGTDAGFTVLKGDGAGGFSRGFDWTGVGGWEGMRLGGDADHNGYPDITGAFGGTNPVRFWKNMGTGGPDATMVSPRGGEKFYPGSVRFIDWYAKGTTPAKLEISTTGTTGPWTLIKDALPNNGRYQWTVPNTPSKNCYIRVTSGSSVGTNPRPFEILGSQGPAPLVAVVSAPNGGENLTAGSTFDVKFTVSGGTMPAAGTLDLSIAGPSGPWSKIADLAALSGGGGSYTWTVPATPTSQGFVRLTLQDAGPTPQSANDASNSAFTIYVQDLVILDRVEVSPTTATLDIGASATFTAKATDTKGRDITGATFNWSMSLALGALTPQGSTASLLASSYGSATVHVESSFGGVTRGADASVEVRRPVLTKLVLDPTTASGKVGDIVRFNAKAFDDKGAAMPGVAIAWSVTSSIGGLNATSGGFIELTMTAGGNGEIVARASADGKEVEARAKVTVRAPFQFPWDLVFIVLAVAVALIAIGIFTSRRKKKKRAQPEWATQQWPSQQF